jgi:hypothetical protein
VTSRLHEIITRDLFDALPLSFMILDRSFRIV